MITKNEINNALWEEKNKRLLPCPFCGGKTEFHETKNEKAPLNIRHIPEAGVNCPVRFDQFCESFDQGEKWWNRRSVEKPKEAIVNRTNSEVIKPPVRSKRSEQRHRRKKRDLARISDNLIPRLAIADAFKLIGDLKDKKEDKK